MHAVLQFLVVERELWWAWGTYSTVPFQQRDSLPLWICLPRGWVWGRHFVSGRTQRLLETKQSRYGGIDIPSSFWEGQLPCTWGCWWRRGPWHPQNQDIIVTSARERNSLNWVWATLAGRGGRPQNRYQGPIFEHACFLNNGKKK